MSDLKVAIQGTCRSLSITIDSLKEAFEDIFSKEQKIESNIFKTDLENN